MSMSTHVVAFRPPDERWHNMKFVYDACVQAGIPIPDEVENFFNGEEPDESGVEIDIDNILQKWGDDSRDGYQLELSRLPKEITIIRFYNAW